ncbi:MAG: helix-hairpin-helix domain-containing protein [Limosilactobacillus sp.]|nr:helix-hairpin-helix domain-containing protein [Limosilactobacillus sp.]
MKQWQDVQTLMLQFFNHRRRQVIISLTLVVVLGGWMLTHWSTADESSQMATNSRTVIKSGSTATNNHRGVTVDAKGAVKQPGVNTLKHGARIQEALKQAGGPLPTADMRQVNLAKQVTDQQMVYIPAQGEVQTTAGLANANESSQAIVNLNTATKEQLLTLTGIGDKKADQILAYRQQHGEFKQVEDMKNVDGIGDKTVAKLKDSLAV